MKINNLQDTVEMMTSADYKERFAAEYHQLVIRINGLKSMLQKWDNHELEFTPTCTRDVLDGQLNSMNDYLKSLIVRAKIENIVL